MRAHASLRIVYLVPVRTITLTLSQAKILDHSNFKDVADDDLKFDVNGRKFSKPVENTVEKGEEIARYEQFLFFPQRFPKTCAADT